MADTSIIIGAGLPDGIGGATALRFAKEGLHVIVSGRTQAKLDQTVSHIRKMGGSAEAFVADVTSARDMSAVFDRAKRLGQPISSVVFNAGNNHMVSFADLSVEDFEANWRVCCFGGFLTAKLAMPILSEQGAGSIIFTGASASLRGKPGFGHFASAKAALRNLVQALAREYGPKGVHVAHIIVDGVVNGDRAQANFGNYLEKLSEDGALQPAAIADAYWMVHSQHRSAWTHELDLRPFLENW